MNKSWDFKILQALASPGGSPASCATSDPDEQLLGMSKYTIIWICIRNCSINLIVVSVSVLRLASRENRNRQLFFALTNHNEANIY